MYEFPLSIGSSIIIPECLYILQGSCMYGDGAAVKWGFDYKRA